MKGLFQNNKKRRIRGAYGIVELPGSYLPNS